MMLSPWPPTSGVAALPVPGIPFMAVPELCAHHRPPGWVLMVPQCQYLLAVLAAFHQLPQTRAECGDDPDRFARAVKCAAPLCCALGDSAMEDVARQVRAVWALRN